MAAGFVQREVLHGHVRVHRVVPVAPQGSVVQGAGVLHGVCGRVFRVVHGDEAGLHAGGTPAQGGGFGHEHRLHVAFRQELARGTLHQRNAGGGEGDHGRRAGLAGGFRAACQGEQGGGFQQECPAVHALDFFQHGLELAGNTGKIRGDGGKVVHTTFGGQGMVDWCRKSLVQTKSRPLSLQRKSVKAPALCGILHPFCHIGLFKPSLRGEPCPVRRPLRRRTGRGRG